MTREELAQRLMRGMQTVRLERIGEPVPPERELASMPMDERQNWLDMADVVRRIFGHAPVDQRETVGLVIDGMFERDEDMTLSPLDLLDILATVGVMFVGGDGAGTAYQDEIRERSFKRPDHP